MRPNPIHQGAASWQRRSIVVYIHMVFFEGRNDHERIWLPDKSLFEEYLKWLRDGETRKGGWYYEHHEGTLTVINFEKVASMTVRPQPDSRSEAPPPPSAEHPLSETRPRVAMP